MWGMTSLTSEETFKSDFHEKGKTGSSKCLKSFLLETSFFFYFGDELFHSDYGTYICPKTKAEDLFLEINFLKLVFEIYASYFFCLGILEVVPNRSDIFCTEGYRKT